MQHEFQLESRSLWNNTINNNDILYICGVITD